MMEALAVGLLGVVILAAWLVPKWRLRCAISRPLPPEHVAILARNVMQYSGMDDLQRQQLARMVQHFLHQKKFVGCAGLELTDEMRVTIAGQACLLLLGRVGGSGLSGSVSGAAQADRCVRCGDRRAARLAG
jgi:Mlc titration factor MtfA (ptsG expression regulator)